MSETKYFNISDERNFFFFFLMTIAWTWFFWGISALISNDIISTPISEDIFTALGGLGPILIALVLTFITSGKKGIITLIKRGVDYKFDKKWWVPILLLVPLIFIITYFIISFMQIVPSIDLTRILNTFPEKFVYFFLGVAIAEEFGWRGFSLDRLQSRFQKYKYTAVISSIILGIAWGFWHLPLFFTAGTSQSGWSFLLFLWLIISTSILFTWLHNNTNGSVLTAMFFHTTLNLCVNFIPIFLIRFYYPDLSPDLAFIVVNIIMTVIVIIVIAYWGPKDLAQEKKRIGIQFNYAQT